MRMQILTQTFKNIFESLKGNSGKEREICHLLVHSLNGLQQPGLVQAEPRDQDLHLGLSLGWQGPKYLRHCDLLPCKVH